MGPTFGRKCVVVGRLAADASAVACLGVELTAVHTVWMRWSCSIGPALCCMVHASDFQSLLHAADCSSSLQPAVAHARLALPTSRLNRPPCTSPECCHPPHCLTPGCPPHTHTPLPPQAALRERGAKELPVLTAPPAGTVTEEAKVPAFKLRCAPCCAVC